MPCISFAPTGTRNTALIMSDNRCIGLVFKETDYIGARHAFYTIDLNSDPRGIKIVHNRALLHEIIEDRIATHPSPQPLDLAAAGACTPTLPF